jgi:hypothetical protein
MLVATGVKLGVDAINDSVNKKNQREIDEENAARDEFYRYEDRKWSLEDRDYTNQYNSPLQQMQRFRDAGLNPNLVYGKFDAGQSTMPRGVTSTPYEKKSFQRTATIPDNIMSQYAALQSLQMLELQKQNMEIKNSNDAINRDRNERFFNVERQVPFGEEVADFSSYDYFQATTRGKTFKANAEMYKADSEAIKYNMLVKKIDSEQAYREELVTLAKNNNALASQKLKLLQQDAVLKAIEIEREKRGISKNSPAYLKFIDTFLDKELGVKVNE